MIVLVAAGLVLYGRHAAAGMPILVPIGVLAAGAALLILAVDVPLYVSRWRVGKRAGLRYLRIVDGLKDTIVRRHVTQRRVDWQQEMLWMSLYFSAGVWVSSTSFSLERSWSFKVAVDVV